MSGAGPSGRRVLARPPGLAGGEAEWRALLPVLLWLSLVSLAAWIRWSSSWWLLASTITGIFSGSTLLARRVRPDFWLAAGVVLLLTAIAGAWWGSARLGTVTRGWDDFLEAHDARLEATLNDRFGSLVVRGQEAVAHIAVRDINPETPAYWAFLEGVRQDAGLHAVAVFNPNGRLAAWAGNHQGAVPVQVRTGWDAYVYEEGPVYTYLYFTRLVGETGATAVAAALLRSNLPEGVAEPGSDFSTLFEQDTGRAIRISRSGRATAVPFQGFNRGGEPLLSIFFEPETQGELLESVRLRWNRRVAVLLALSWLLLVFGLRGTPRHALLTGLALASIAGLLPFGELLGLAWLFSPAQFLLPGTTAGTLGRALALGMAGVFAAGLAAPGRSRRSLLAGAALAGLGFAAVIRWFLSSPTTSYLGASAQYWLVYQGALCLGLTMVALAAFRLAGRTDDGRPGTVWMVAGLVLALVLGLAVYLRFQSVPPSWTGLLWAVPMGVVARGLHPGARWQRALCMAFASVVLAVSATLPFTWGNHVAARMEVARTRLSTLGSQVDPYLQFVLGGLSEKANSLYASGMTGTDLIYGLWSTSGLVQEGVPVWIDRWTPDGVATDALRIGVSGPRPPVVRNYLKVAAEGATVLRVDLQETHYLGMAALPDGSVITAAVPPRREIGGSSSSGVPLGSEGNYRDIVTLIPLNEGDPVAGDDPPQWVRTPGGWRGERTIRFSEGWYRAHYTAELPERMILVAGTVLVMLVDLVVVLGIWSLGRWLVFLPERWPVRWRRWPGRSFRVRVTFALFAFFLVPALAFAALASRTLDGAAGRTAEALAGRAVEQAAEDFLRVEGDLRLVPEGGTDLLLYQDGELSRSSSPTLRALGVQRGWLPAEVFRALTVGDAVLVHAPETRWAGEHVVAYRRLQTGQVLASAAPLDAGATAFGQNDLVLLLAFAILSGVALSLGLALLVGRALAHPIRSLRMASEKVGEGDLKVHLPERHTDEFGAVFVAFNHMVERLRRARSALVRTTQRTQAIVDEAPTGVIALDHGGVVTLVNPQARRLLGPSLEPGARLSATEGPAHDLSRWVEHFRAGGVDGADQEFELSNAGNRRVRVRARRITLDEPSPGVVLSLEDVTDELRSERILAWGEMARQVAHEVKNPLTPIKLSVEHVRRAWHDRRRDFTEILDRNVESIMREIDRLAKISRSFSRYGSPRKASEVPLEGVDINSTVGEILTLYRSGEEAIAIDADIPEGLPKVRSRESELKEVLINLLENAREAVQAQGSVRIEAFTVTEGVCLQVNDNGRGIQPELMHRIFEPRFSTRSTGTGLGLAIVQRLVRSWGGHIRAESTPGMGTVMSIRFVLWESFPEADAPGTGAGRTAGKGQD